ASGYSLSRAFGRLGPADLFDAWHVRSGARDFAAHRRPRPGPFSRHADPVFGRQRLGRKARDRGTPAFSPSDPPGDFDDRFGSSRRGSPALAARAGALTDGIGFRLRRFARAAHAARADPPLRG